MLPDPIKLLIAAVIAYLVTEGEKVIGQWFGKDLSGVFAGFAAILTTSIIVFAESLLGLVDEQYRATVEAVFGLLVALLGAFGVHKMIKRLA